MRKKYEEIHLKKYEGESETDDLIKYKNVSGLY